MLHAIVTILPQPYYQQVEALWDELEEKFGLSGIRITPYPHFSWQVAESYPEEKLLHALTTIVNDIKPFEVHIRGIDVFFSQNPVVFLKILKEKALARLHLKVWMKLLPLANRPNFLYSPLLWRPHISLAYQDLTLSKLKDITTFLKQKDLNWNFSIDNISLVCQTGDEVGQLKHKIQIKH